MSNYPESDKLLAVSGESQNIGYFLDWLRSQGYYLCKFQEEEYNPEIDEMYPAGFYPTYERIEELLAKYFQIDMDKVDDERRQMLEDLRNRSK